MHNEIIYIDNNATTALDKNVLEAMMPYLTYNYANAASSTHAMGWQAKAAIELSRKKVSDLLECEENEIVFTSGASESIYLALTAAYNAYKVNGNKIISCKTEHKAVLNVLDYLHTLGAEVVYLDVNREGIIDLEDLKSEIDSKTILVCLQLCNNETGVVQPLEEISAITHANNAILFSDATQAPGKMIFNIHDLGIDLMPLSAHKMYGPKGVGALFVRRKNPRITLLPLVKGNQERDLRNGTYNTPAIVGFGEACSLIKENLWSDVSRISKLRTKLEHHLTEDNFGFINGSVKNRICNTTNLHFPGIKASELLKKTREISYSLGSACNSSSPLPSYVLCAMGLSKSEAEASVRLSLGRNNSEQDIDKAIEQMRNAVVELRN
jgi:cysteine desulfurase